MKTFKRIECSGKDIERYLIRYFNNLVKMEWLKCYNDPERYNTGGSLTSGRFNLARHEAKGWQPHQIIYILVKFNDIRNPRYRLECCGSGYGWLLRNSGLLASSALIGDGM